ncbi:hypothetical protein AHAS_Ahas20G0108200 [Arachis hypogaea]
MEERMQRYLFFAVTKGAHPGVYSSWEEANEQVSNYSFPEYHGFNSYEHALQCFKSRMVSIDADKAANVEMFGTQSEGVSGGKGVFPSGSSRRHGLVSCMLYLALDVFVFGNVLDCVVFVFDLPGVLIL